MKPPAHPYRRLVFRDLHRDDEHCMLSGAESSLRLTTAEFEAASQIDGERSAAMLRAAAGSDLDLDELVQRLSARGLLEAGYREPLPPPVQYDHARPRRVSRKSLQLGGPMVPSTLPGAMGGPSLVGTLTGLYGWERGEAAELDLAFSVRWLRWLGDALNLFLFGPLRLVLLGVLTIAALVVMYSHRFEMGRDLGQLLKPVSVLLYAVGGASLIDGLVKLARYAAIVRCAHVRPRFGVTLGGQGLPMPHFFTETRGPVELVDRASRMRIVGASLAALLVIYVAATLVWLMYHRQGNIVAPLAVGMMYLSASIFLVQINPLGKRGGYQLLVQALRCGDLREQAGFALFGREMGWSSVRRPPKSALLLYEAAVILYLVWVLVFFLSGPAVWMKKNVGPIGPLLVIGAVGYMAYNTLQRTFAGQFKIGEKVTVSFWKQPLEWTRQTADKTGRWLRAWWKANRPGPTWTALLIIAFIICLLPYPYDPSGSLVVLPDSRADINAQVAGEVRQVFVKEGDRVKAGTALAQLADEDEKAQLAGAEATLVKLQSNLAIGQAGHRPEEVDVARQAVNTAQTAYQYAREEADRLASAFQRKAVSEQDYKRALSVAEINQQKLIETRRQLTLTSSPTRSDEIKGLQAEIAHQQAQVEYQKTLLGYTQIRAPIDGRIVSGSLQFAVGDFMQRGAMLATVEDSDHPQIEVKIPEDDVAEIKLGNKARAKIWGAPNSAYRGQVVRIAPSAEAAPYGRVVRVYISVDQPDDSLKPEMTGYAKIDGRWHLLILAFTRPIVRLLFVEMWSWIP